MFRSVSSLAVVSRRQLVCAAIGVLLWAFAALRLVAGDDARPAADAQPADTGASASLDNCELYPLGIGRESLFKSGPLELVEHVTRHEKVGDELCARVETVFNGKVVSYEHIAVRADGVYRVAVAGKPVEPPLRFLKLPAEPGETWSVKSVILGQSITGDFTIDKKPLKIADDEVQAFVVEGRNFKAGKSELAFTYYFVPGVGKVKQVVTANGQETTLELPALPKPGIAESAPAEAGKL